MHQPTVDRYISGLLVIRPLGFGQQSTDVSVEANYSTHDTITKEAKPRKKSNTDDKGDQRKPPPSATRSSIKQALQLFD